MSGVLIAEDTPLIRAAIAQIVARERPDLGPLYEVGCGEDAVELARSIRPDVVLMDIKMPGVSGIEAGARIRAEHPGIGLVFLTAHEDFGYAQQALRMGAADYLLKPVRPQQLLAALDRIQARLNTEMHAGPARPEFLSGQPALRAEEGRQRPLAQALDYMEHNLHRSDLRLREVAEAARLSASHLAALLRQELGYSYLAHLSHLRIERAKRLLLTTDLTVAAVSLAVGYETPAPFYQRFKQATGLTPNCYREQIHG